MLYTQVQPKANLAVVALACAILYLVAKNHMYKTGCLKLTIATAVIFSCYCLYYNINPPMPWPFITTSLLSSGTIQVQAGGTQKLRWILAMENNKIEEIRLIKALHNTIFSYNIQ